MLLSDAQNRLTELTNINLALANVLGPTAQANLTLLAEAAAGLETAADINVFMADIESRLDFIGTDPPADDSDFDNSGVVVEEDDGTSMSYDDWLASAQPSSDAGYVDSYVAPDLSEWDAHRKATVGVVDMSHLEV